MGDRMELMKLYTSQGIYNLKDMRSHYNGVPYRDLHSSDYDYFNAHPSNIAKTKYEHSTSRNPKTGQLLKSENHPTFDLMINGEEQAGYKVVRGNDGNLYSIPNRPDNYVEDYNRFYTGGYKEGRNNGYEDITPAVVKPEPMWATLNTYYPIVSEYPYTGHSELDISDNKGKHITTITKYGDDFDYNLVTNNCSDATRCAIEEIFGESINPMFFTTPGDVKTFLTKKGINPIKTGVGVQSQDFKIPFATAMDLYNKQLDHSIDNYRHTANRYKEKKLKEDPNWNVIEFDKQVEDVINNYNSRKYIFQPFKNSYGGKLKFDTGGLLNAKSNMTYLDTFDELNPAIISEPYQQIPLADSFRNYLNNKMWDTLIQSRIDKNNRKKSKKNSITSTLVHLVVGSRILDGTEDEQTLSGFPFKPVDGIDLSLNAYDAYKQKALRNSQVTVVPEAPIDNNEIVRRQAWAESAGNDKAKSERGARGRYQIMPTTLTEYQKVTGDKGNIDDPVYNRKVRDYEFNRYDNTYQVNRGNPTDSVKMARKLAIYNYGFGNTRKALNRADSLGIDIDSTFNWLDELPKETQDYVNFILRNKDTGGHRTNREYRRHRAKLGKK